MGDATFPIFNNHMFIIIKIKAPGGGGGIRTHGRLSPTSVFKTGAFNHSATPPTTMEVLGFCDVIKRLSEKKFTALKVGYLTL